MNTKLYMLSSFLSIRNLIEMYEGDLYSVVIQFNAFRIEFTKFLPKEQKNRGAVSL